MGSSHSPSCDNVPLSNIFLKNKKCLAKNLNKLFCFRGFHSKCCFHYAFDDNLSVTHIFIKQIFRAVELTITPSSPSPQQGCAGGGVVVALFSHKDVALVMAMKQ
jgi:hypothetical protein